MAAKLDRIAADTAPRAGCRQLREVRRTCDFRFGLFPVTALRDAPSMARCCRWTAATAALVHQPAARFAILSHRLRGLPLMSRPPPGATGRSRKGFEAIPVLS